MAKLRPQDLQRLQRLVHALAINWWTCHEELEEEVVEKEMKGLELKRKLQNVEKLSFLFLSTLCLHHHLHESHGQMDLEAFQELHQGLDLQELLPEIYQQILTRTTHFACPELSRKHLRPRNKPENWLPPATSPDSRRLEAVSELQGEQMELQAWVCIVSTPHHELANVGQELWAALTNGLLFFCHSPSSHPEAFMALQEVRSSVKGLKGRS